MDKLTSMKVFSYVAEQGSFKRAADYFSLSPTMIGKHIKHLESVLNTQLIHRTTRTQTLTESGNIYLIECRRILEDITNTESLIHDLENRPTGTIKINAPITLGTKVLSGIVAEFMITHPDIHIDLELDNSLVDPYQSDLDFIFRIGELSDSNMVGRYLGDYQLLYCASANYLSSSAQLREPQDLSKHTCLGFRYHDVASNLTSKSAGHEFSSTKPRLTANNGEVLCQAAIQGLGVLLQPKILVAPYLTSGQLVEVLSNHVPAAKPVHLLYKAKQLSVKNRTFADFVVQKCRSNTLNY